MRFHLCLLAWFLVTLSSQGGGDHGNAVSTGRRLGFRKVCIT